MNPISLILSVFFASALILSGCASSKVAYSGTLEMMLIEGEIELYDARPPVDDEPPPNT